MGKKTVLVSIGLAIMLVISTVPFACKAPAEKKPTGEADEDVSKPSISISSPAFEDGATIPGNYSCLGENTSPQLTWSEGPAGTVSFVLIVDDADAPGRPFTHWVLYEIRPDITELHKGISTNGMLETGAIQGRNSLGKLGYYGPCPPEGESHHYRFTIYAIDKFLGLPSASREQVLEAIQGHILASGQLTGTFKK